MDELSQFGGIKGAFGWIFALYDWQVNTELIPLWQPHSRTIIAPPEEIYLITDGDEQVLTGELFTALAPNIDGRATVAEITAKMVAEGSATEQEVPAAIQILMEHGFVVDASEVDGPLDVYRMWWRDHISADLSQNLVAVLGVGDVPTTDIRESISAHGLGITADLALASVVVVIADDYLNPDIESVAQAAYELGTPVLLANICGVMPSIGPWLGSPGPCWQCLAVRLQFNRQVEKRLLSDGERMGPIAKGWTPTTLAHAGGEIALELLRTFAGRPHASAHQDPAISMMTIIDHLNGDRTIHHVVRRPQCETCGEPLTLENAPVEIVLETGALDAKDDGSYRRLTPQQTLDTYGHQVSRITGVVEHLQRTNLDNDVTHVVESGVNLATVKKGAKVCGFRQNAGGKGTTPEQARAGALAEAIERYAATYAGDEPSMVYSMTKLGELAIDPRSCMLFSDHQYDTREEWNASRNGKHVIPKRFDPDVEMPWSPIWSLTEQRRVWLPTSYTFYNYVGEYPRNGCSSDSNGNAAGTSIEDAILQGFFELVERDAVSTWWYNGINRPGVDIDAYATTYADPYFNRLRAHYSEVLDRDIWALDVTSDLGIPAFVAASKARTGLPRILLGFGAHRDPRGALLRSLTEMNQMLGMIASMEAQGAPTELDVSKPEVNWWYTPTMDQHPYVLPDPTLALTTPTDHAHDWNTDGKANVEKVVALLADHGMTMSVVNMTKPDIGMPVVKVVVPGIRHFWPRFAPGRLYEVPVKMGWRDTALTEPELNPTPIFW